MGANYIDRRYNVLVIGKSGVGKSSFVNYLYGQDVAKTGTGKPQTERGFHKYEFALGEEKLPTVLYDSWGLEADKYKEWMDRFRQELDEHGVDKPAAEWFHSVFYIINGTGHRVEPVDIAVVNMLIEQKYCVNIVINQSDALSEEEKSAMRGAVLGAIPDASVIFMASGGENRAGPIKTFGKDEVARQAIADFFESLLIRLPLHARFISEQWKQEWRSFVRFNIDNVGRDDDKQVAARIEEGTNRQLGNLRQTLNDEICKTLEVYGHVFSSFGALVPVKVDPDKGFTNDGDDGLPLFAWATLPLWVVPGFLIYFLAGRWLNKDKLEKDFLDMERRVDKELEDWFFQLGQSLKNMRGEYCSKA